MNNWLLVVQAAIPIVSLLAALTTYLNARNAKKAQESAAASEKNVKEIEESIEKETKRILDGINNKSRIAKITEIKSKTEVFQKFIKQYQVDPSTYDMKGLDKSEVASELGNYITIIKENNWIFDGENENYNDTLYSEFSIYFSQLSNGADNEEIYKIVINLKFRLEFYNSMLNKVMNQNIINS
ncbi:hypothetical protein OCF64_12980 [Bacillus wiedmannii]|uniref:hypothetical protein n=1 Tax=Bacillus wiedmannii TaxID=1890302 RepID=UPI0021CEFECA|nr:hypothetical protein [Bacillus wiedmannii]MCU5682773.1 hypothetical protein [Bacillus wiedmannii]